MYALIRAILFCLEPERAHAVTLKMLNVAHTLRLTALLASPSPSPRYVMGLKFPNVLGLAAGLDKNGEYIDALAALGFGFIEVGTITPRPQLGNPPPRLFRLASERALINRLGFNNLGVDYLVAQLKKTTYQGILGVNIGKNRDTSLENAVEDYLTVFRRVAAFASYVTVNISSPNTENLRQLQQSEWLQPLLRALKSAQNDFYISKKKYVPLVVKIAPDLSLAQLTAMGEIFLAEKIDGVIATNTTLRREGVASSPFVAEAGGLSGKPLQSLSTEVIKTLRSLLGDSIPIIGCGGIASARDAEEKIAAGASLVQLYTGLIYQGPALVRALAAIP